MIVCMMNINREGEPVCVCEREKDRKTEMKLILNILRGRESLIVCMMIGKGEAVFLCVCVSLCECVLFVVLDLV